MNKICPECGQPLEEPGHACPVCLLGLGLTHDLSAMDVHHQKPMVRLDEIQGDQIGSYKLLEIIGRGGFGMVWMAEQQAPLRRCVALKILKLGMDSKEIVARFEAERQALALMDHPNIARVYDAGTTEAGRPFFVMELVRGVPITEFCDVRLLSTRERIKLFIDVCCAVQHAHQKGVIHRDLKPTNILVTEQDGRAVPKVVDFGIAKATSLRLTEKTLVTGFNQLVGTPVYMSPEQAGLGGLDVDSRSDIYTLGVLLYELVTGQVPLNLRAASVQGCHAVFDAIRASGPMRPSNQLSSLSRDELTRVAQRRKELPDQLTRTVNGELDWLVLKSLEKDRNRRYQTANALATDLANYLAGEPISAAPPTLQYQLSKFARKHRGPLLSAAALLVVLIGGVAATSWQALRATRLARTQSELRNTAEKARDQNRVALYSSEMAAAFRNWELGQAARARQILEEQRPGPAERDLRGWEWRYLWKESRPRERKVIGDQPGYVSSMCFSPDGGRLAVAAGGNGRIRLWDTRDWRILKESKLGWTIIDTLAFTADGSGLLASLRATNFVLLDAGNLEQVASFAGHTQPVCAIAVDPVGHRIVSAAGTLWGGSEQGEMFLWDLDNRRVEFRFPTAANATLMAQFSPSGSYLARPVNRRGLVEVWDMRNRARLVELKASHTIVNMAAFSPDEETLATCGTDGFVRLWNWRRGDELATVGYHAGPINSVAFSPDGKKIVSCGFDATIRIFATAGLTEQVSLRGHTGPVRAALFSPDGQYVVSGGGADHSLRFWDATVGEAEIILDRGRQSMARCQFLAGSDDLCLLRVDDDGSSLKLWKTTGPGSFEAPIRAAVSSDRILATATAGEMALLEPGNGEVSLQNPRSGQERLRLQSLVPLTGTLAASRDGRWLAALGAPNYLMVWDVASGERVAAFQIPANVIGPQAVAGNGVIQFSADSNQLWIAHQNWMDILECAWRSPGRFRRLVGHSGGISSLALSRDGKILASGSTDMTARLWDAGTGQGARTLFTESGGAISLAFSPDDRTLAIGCFDGQLKLWNVQAKSEMVTLHSQMSIIYSVAFSADGRKLVSSSYDGTTRLWEAPLLSETTSR